MHKTEDPLALEPVEKIRYAEQLMRHDHRVLGANYKFWGGIADYLNEAAHIPSLCKDAKRPRDNREFNRAQDIADGYIRMSLEIDKYA